MPCLLARHGEGMGGVEMREMCIGRMEGAWGCERSGTEDRDGELMEERKIE